MQPAASAQTGDRRAARERGWRLSPGAHKATLLVHIASAGAWLGLDVAMGVLVFTAVFTDDESKKALCYRALDLFVVWPLLTAGLICLASGLLLGFGTVWGVFKYWWVLTKLGLNLVLTGLVPIALRPEINKLADTGRRVASGEIVGFDESNIVFPPIVSPGGAAHRVHPGGLEALGTHPEGSAARQVASCGGGSPTPAQRV